MLASGIYRIRNTVNGKVYVGSSKHAQRRMQAHKRLLRLNKHHSSHLQAAWNIDGEAAFVFDLIVVCAEADLLLYEQIAIDAYKAHINDFGYNQARIAGSTRGFKHSPETKAALSKARAGRKRSLEWVANMSASRIGKPRDPEAVQKTGLANLGKRRSPAVRAMISNHRTGSKASDEVKAAMSVSRTGRKLSLDAIEKLRATGGKKPKLFVMIDGERLKVKDAAVRLGINRATVLYRLKTGAMTAVD